MMVVRADSWHYRLYSFWNNVYEKGCDSALPSRWRAHPVAVQHKPNSLCSYFWSIVLLTLFSIPAAVFMALVFVPVAYLILGINVLIERRRAKKRNESPDKKKARTPKLVVEYLKAKKQRVCPLIQVLP
jgi:hypothetical protein